MIRRTPIAPDAGRGNIWKNVRARIKPLVPIRIPQPETSRDWSPAEAFRQGKLRLPKTR
jgi:hypothetical protein